MISRSGSAFSRWSSWNWGSSRPPVGMNVFVISGIARDVPMRETFLGVMPFFGAEILRVGMLIAFPALVLWFPHWMAG